MKKVVYLVLFLIFTCATISTSNAQIFHANYEPKEVKTAHPLPCKLKLFSSCATQWDINGGVQINSNQNYEGVTSQNLVNWFCPYPAHGQILVVVIMDANGKMVQKKYDFNSVTPRVIALPEGGMFFATLREKDARDTKSQIEP
jgi:hypothetical protein